MICYQNIIYYVKRLSIVILFLYALPAISQHKQSVNPAVGIGIDITKSAVLNTTTPVVKQPAVSTSTPKKKTTPQPTQKTAKYTIPKADSLSVPSRYAQFMQVPDTCIHLQQLYTAIDEWIGTPYRYGRNEKGKGTDCSGFVGKVYQQLFSAQLPRSAAGVATVIDEKPKNELQEGDLLIFNFRGRRNSHVGIYLQNGWFVHASNVYGVTLANLNTKLYQQKYSKGGSVKNIDMAQFAPPVNHSLPTKTNDVQLTKLHPQTTSRLLN